MPLAEPDLTVVPLAFTEPIVFAVGRRHPLADRASVSLSDLSSYPVLPSGLPIPEYWEAAVTPAPGSSANQEPSTNSPAPRTREEVLWAVMSGEGVAFACAQGIKYLERADVVYVPIDERPTMR